MGAPTPKVPRRYAPARTRKNALHTFRYGADTLISVVRNKVSHYEEVAVSNLQSFTAVCLLLVAIFGPHVLALYLQSSHKTKTA